MKSLTIKDLPISKELDSKAMRTVRGGNGYGADKPIKFDALIGDAILRQSNADASAYNAIPIQEITNFDSAAIAAQAITKHFRENSP